MRLTCIAISSLAAALTFAQEAPSQSVALPSSGFFATPVATSPTDGPSQFYPSTGSVASSASAALSSLASRASDAGTPTTTGAAAINDAQYAAMLGGAAVVMHAIV